MNTLGLYEAKTKLSEICERVAQTGEPVVVTKRGAWVLMPDRLLRRPTAAPAHP